MATTKGLRLLIPIKRTIDYAIKPRISKSHTSIDSAGVKHSMNPFDELSIEEAVRLRERSSPPIADILAVSAGPAKSADVLRTAMAMGADRSIHVQISDEQAAEVGGLEPLMVAKLLARIAKEEKSDLLILGKQSIDDDAGQTGGMVAGLLGWPQATQASEIKIEEAGEGYAAQVTKEVDGGVETVKARLPMVVTTDLRLNEPRYASLPNIMKAKKKPMEKKSLQDYGIELGERRLKTLKVEEPPERKGGGKVEDVDGMISRLKELGALA